MSLPLCQRLKRQQHASHKLTRRAPPPNPRPLINTAMILSLLCEKRELSRIEKVSHHDDSAGLHQTPNSVIDCEILLMRNERLLRLNSFYSSALGAFHSGMYTVHCFYNKSYCRINERRPRKTINELSILYKNRKHPSL